MHRNSNHRYPALAIDTSATLLDIALQTSEGLDRQTISAGRRHNELLAPTIRTLLERNGISPSDLSIVACTIGPGSFTGLRIGLSTAKGLTAIFQHCRLVGVPTLDAFARAAQRRGGERYETGHSNVLCAIDGRKQRFYAAFYRDGERMWGPADAPPDEMAARLRELCGETIIVVGPDNDAVIEAMGGEASLGSVTFERSSAYESGVAAAVLDIAFSDTDGAFALAINAGPDYLRGSQADE